MSIESLSVNDFLTLYPDIHDKNFVAKITNLKEFNVLKDGGKPNLEKEHSLLRESTNLFPDQIFFQRFFSQHTPYRECLVFKGVGTGKSTTAIAVGENFKTSIIDGTPLKKALILTKSNDLIRSYIGDIVKRYGHVGYGTQKTGKKLLKKSYEFATYQTFLNDAFDKRTDESLRKEYGGRTIIVDESHNFIDSEGDKSKLQLYKKLERFMNALNGTGARKLLLTGTPMKNSVNDIASQMNLLLPPEDRFDPNIKATFFKDSEFRQELKEQFIEKIRGRVSYLREPWVGEKRIEGEDVRPWTINHKIYLSEMSKEQTAIVKNIDKKKEAFLQNSLRACVATEPPQGSLKKDDVHIYSSKLSALVNLIEDAEEKGECVYIYTDYVNDVKDGENKIPGAISFFKKVMSMMKYTDISKGEKMNVKQKAFVSITSEGPTGNDLQNILTKFNSASNKNGEYCRVIIGGPKIQEGYSFYNIRQIHILNPQWHIAALTQAVARGIRQGSLDAFKSPEDKYVKIYHHVATFEGFSKIKDTLRTKDYNSELVQKWETPDLRVSRISEEKEHEISQIVRILKENAIDCLVNYSKNKLEDDKDGSKECDYQKCDYQCNVSSLSGKDTKGSEASLIESHYNNLYSNPEVEDLKKRIIKLFSSRFYLHFFVIKSLLDVKDSNEVILILALEDIIDNQIHIQNKFGFINYLKEKGNIYYLSATAIETDSNGYLNCAYVEHPIIKQQIILDAIISGFENYEDAQKIRDNCDGIWDGTYDLVKHISHRSLVFMAEEFYAASLSSPRVSNNPVLESLISKFMKFGDDSRIYHRLLYEDKLEFASTSRLEKGLKISAEGKSRIFSPTKVIGEDGVAEMKMKWKYMSLADEKKTITVVKTKEPKQKIEEYSGMIVGDKFKVLRPGGKSAGTDCNSISLKDLHQIIKEIDDYVPLDELFDEDDSRYLEIIQRTSGELIDEISASEDNPYTVEEIEDYDIDKLQSIFAYQLYYHKKKQMCEYLQKLLL